MIMIFAALSGAVYGGLKARRMKGNTYDIAHYSVIHALGFGLVGLLITIGIENLL